MPEDESLARARRVLRGVDDEPLPTWQEVRARADRPEDDESAPVLLPGSAASRGRHGRDATVVAVAAVLVVLVAFATRDLAGMRTRHDARTTSTSPAVVGDPGPRDGTPSAADAQELLDEARDAVGAGGWCVAQLIPSGAAEKGRPDAVYLDQRLAVALLARGSVEIGRSATTGEVVGIDNEYRRWWDAGEAALTADPVVAAAVTALHGLATEGDGAGWAVADPATPSLWTTVGSGASGLDVEVLLDRRTGLPAAERVTRLAADGPEVTQVRVSWLPCDTKTAGALLVDVPVGYKGYRDTEGSGQD